MRNKAYWVERIAKTKATLAIYEDAVDALAQEGILSYTLDTGQTRQVVTQVDVIRMENSIDRLLNRIATLEARVYGCGTSIGRPAW